MVYSELEARVSRSTSKQLAVRKKSSPAVVPARAVASSLPPTPDQVPASPTTTQPEKTTMVREKAVAIVAMRAMGFSREEIASELRIKPKSVSQYIWLATKSGWLPTSKGELIFNDPKSQIKYELAHKAVRNVSEFLDSDNPKLRAEFTLKLAEGALFGAFKQNTETATLPNMQQVLAIKIEHSETSTMAVREGSIGGVGAYSESTEGDIVP